MHSHRVGDNQVLAGASFAAATSPLAGAVDGLRQPKLFQPFLPQVPVGAR